MGRVGTDKEIIKDLVTGYIYLVKEANKCVDRLWEARKAEDIEGYKAVKALEKYSKKLGTDMQIQIKVYAKKVKLSEAMAFWALEREYANTIC